MVVTEVKITIVVTEVKIIIVAYIYISTEKEGSMSNEKMAT